MRTDKSTRNAQAAGSSPATSSRKHRARKDLRVSLFLYAAKLERNGNILGTNRAIGHKNKPGKKGQVVYACPLLCSFGISFALKMWSSLSAISRSTLLKAWPYMSKVVLMFAWPRRLLIFFAGTPSAIRRLAAVCRSPWNGIGGSPCLLRNFTNCLGVRCTVQQ